MLTEGNNRKTGRNFVSNLQGRGWLNYVETVECERETFSNPVNMIGFSSWCNSGYYDLDFGWGKPVWASLNIDLAETKRSVGGMFLVDTRQRCGIEAWVCSAEEDAAALESDGEFLASAIVDPSSLK